MAHCVGVSSNCSGRAGDRLKKIEARNQTKKRDEARTKKKGTTLAEAMWVTLYAGENVSDK